MYELSFEGKHTPEDLKLAQIKASEAATKLAESNEKITQLKS